MFFYEKSNLWRRYVLKYWPNPGKILRHECLKISSVQCTVYSVQKSLHRQVTGNLTTSASQLILKGSEINKVAANPDKITVGLLGVREIIKELIKLKFICRLPSKLIAQEASHPGGNKI